MMQSRHLITIGILLFLVWAALPFFVSAMTITIGIPEKYSEIKAGEKVYFETEVKWPENVGRKDLSIEYSIRDKNGVEVAYLKVLKAIETQASFMGSISIPESVSAGIYKLSAGFNDYQDLNQEVSASFNITKTGNSVEKYLFIIIGVLGVIVLLVLMEMLVLMKRNSHK
jgi:hypothetical protein